MISMRINLSTAVHVVCVMYTSPSSTKRHRRPVFMNLIHGQDDPVTRYEQLLAAWYYHHVAGYLLPENLEDAI